MITVNNVKGISKAYSEVPASLTSLVDLGTEYTYNNLIIMSTLDTEIVIKIGSNEIPIPANKNVTLTAPINGVIYYKYSSAPSSGNLNIIYH